MSIWKQSAMDVETYRDAVEKERKKESSTELQLFDTVEELMETREKMYLKKYLFNHNHTEEVLIAGQVASGATLIWVVFLTVVLKKSVSWQMCFVPMAVLWGVATVLLIMRDCYTTYIMCHGGSKAQVFKGIVDDVTNNHILLRDGTKIKVPKNIFTTVADVYRGKEGTEICFVASENLLDVYGVEYNERILMTA